jgi:uncharacterized damage-inducible protein DinB
MQKETISYAELARRVGDMVLCNSINNVDEFWTEHILETPMLMDAVDKLQAERVQEDKELAESEPASIYDFLESVYQSYIITDSGAEYLVNYTSELVQYVPSLECFVWHVCHYGTPWSGVDVEIRKDIPEERVNVYELIKHMN